MRQRDLDEEKRERELWEDVRVVVAVARWPEHERAFFWKLTKEHPDEARIIAEMVYLLDASPELPEPPPRRWTIARGKSVPPAAQAMLEKLRAHSEEEATREPEYEQSDIRDLL